MNKAYLLIGGNEGERLHYLEQAKKEIEQSCGEISLQSSIYETAAWGIRDQPSFLNQAIMIQTQHNADKLMDEILSIEEKLGRIRKEKYGPRTIDIDILFFNEDIINLSHLRIPHPELQNRRFALVPMNEIAPELVHPGLHKTIMQLLKECKDPLDVKKI
jgi:2-amino-4-hydroxy-6-hydroxymethyldihydropteridine diphosphokinase